MVKRSCSTPGCVKPCRAKGMCSTHYNQANVKPVEAECAACGTLVVKTNQWARARYRTVCSMKCRAYLQNGPSASVIPITHPSRMALTCDIPASHPIRSTPVLTDHPSRRRRVANFHAGLCKECGAGFVIASPSVGTVTRYCSMICVRRTRKRVRRAREHGASGSFTWDSFMRLAQSLGNVCAYCGGTNGDNQLDPDHVMPLSRGGHNGLSNILPACRPCNSSKNDRLPSEWVRLCRSRGIDVDLGRFKHLTAHVFAHAERHAA